MRHTTLLLLALAVGGCGTLSPSARDELQYRRTEYRQQFVDDRARCSARGGRIHILAGGASLDRDGVPLSRVYYRCL